MNINPEKFTTIIRSIDQLVHKLREAEITYEGEIARVKPEFVKSARNLVHYCELRNSDYRKFEKKLTNLGLAGIMNSQPHVLSGLLKAKYILATLLYGESPDVEKAGLSIKNARKIKNRNVKSLLGKSKPRKVRLMVTMPTEAAHDYQLVEKYIRDGMDSARINCAHDTPDVWKIMIENIRKAEKAVSEKVKVTMDLSGQKIRTGRMALGEPINYFKTKTDENGFLQKTAIVKLSGSKKDIPVQPEFLEALKVGDYVSFKDLHGKVRKLEVLERTKNVAVTACNDSFYIKEGTILKLESETKLTSKVGSLSSRPQVIQLKEGEYLRLDRESIPGEPHQFSASGEISEWAHISCETEEVFTQVSVGDDVIFNDGKIIGEVTERNHDHLMIRITRSKSKGGKLKGEKGINFPNTEFKGFGLTEKDKDDLKFVAKHADIVSLSFVNSSAEVRNFLNELKKIESGREMGILLKVETKAAFENLHEIILEGMTHYPMGILIARGDLAVEVGWENMARIQQEILDICQAAHVPDVWATQVLENLAKKGVPTRAEITDAASALKASCVMLNKGPYINEALKMMDYIFKSLEDKSVERIIKNPTPP